MQVYEARFTQHIKKLELENNWLSAIEIATVVRA